MKKFFKQCMFLLDHEAKKKLPLLLFIFLSSSLLDVIGIGLVGAFLLLIVNYSEVLHKLPLALQYHVNQFSENSVIVFVGICLIIAFIFKAYWGIFSQKRMVRFTSQFSVRLKMRLMTGYQAAAYSFHLKQNSGYLINKISMSDSFSNNVVSTSLSIISALFVVVGIITSLALVHPVVTFLLAVMTSIIFICYEFFVKNSVINLGKTLMVSNGEINKSILQALGGIKEVRVLGKENFFLQKIHKVVNQYLYASASYNSLQLIPRYAVESAASIFLVTLVLGALLFGTSPVNMIPTLGIFAAACIRLLPIVSQLIGQFSQLRSTGYLTGVLYDEIITLQNLNESHLNILHDGKGQSFLQFSLQNISFRYDNTKQNALNNIFLSFNRGQSIGLMGTSGAGKSTLVSIILGLLKPDSGELLIDGAPIQNLRKWLNNFAYIPQSIFLLDDTLKHNIAMGSDDDEIDSQKLNDAVVMAQLSDVVANLPQGIDTVIGENGVLLSGGQRQRVALARAFYYDREIIVMDEATSALDHETEREVINSIKRLHGVKTLIVIAHRLTTLQYCDVVYRLEKGEIVAQGSYAEIV